MTGDEMSVLFHDPHDLIDALEGRTVKACDDGCEAHGVLRRVTQRGEERDVGPAWSSPTIYMVDIVTPETGDLICRTDVRNFDLLEVVPMTVPTDTPSTDGAPDPEEGEWHHNVTHRCPQMSAHTFDELPIPCEQCTSVEQLSRSTPWQKPYFFSRPFRSAAAAGFRVVPEDRPTPCDCERFGFKVPGHAVGSNWDWVPCPEGHGPRTPTDDEALVTQLRDECLEFHGEADGITHDCAYVRAADRIIALAAGVPVLDDDTRREVEALIVMLTQNSFHLTQTEMNRIAGLLADAYLERTDGR